MVGPKKELPSKIAARRERNKEILDLVKNVCGKQGGLSEIGDGYYVVDTKLYEVKPK